MSEVNLNSINNEISMPLKSAMNFNKKNAWKNEWEKAQLETKSTNKPDEKTQVQSSKKVKSFGVDEALQNNNVIVNKSELVNTHQTDTAVKYINSDIESKIAYSSVVLNVKEHNLSVNLFSKAVNDVTNNIKPDILKTFSQDNNAQAVIDKSEIKFGSKYKLQNLNILATESGAKMILRDYRLEKNQLTEIVDEIVIYLKEFGVEINEVIVNGMAYEKQ